MNDQIETIRRPAEGSTNLPIVHPGMAWGPGDPQNRQTHPDVGYAAQVLGAAGQRRGLKGGAPVLQAARRAYLGAEWSGRGDRRGGPGSLALTRI